MATPPRLRRMYSGTRDFLAGQQPGHALHEQTCQQAAHDEGADDRQDFLAGLLSP